MEAILRFESRRSWLAFALLLAILSQTFGCAGAKKASTRAEPIPQASAAPGPSPVGEIMGPQELYGPEQVPSPGSTEAAVYGPAPIELRPLTLVLGPGLARGFAFAGAIRALADAKIPIGAIIGTEMGALVGALYAVDSNANHLDWQLQKFKEDVFMAEKNLIPTHRFNHELNSVFATKQIQQTKIPLRVSVETRSGSHWILADQGSLRDAVRAAMATPDLFSPSRWNGSDAISAGRSHPYPVAEARKIASGPVVVIDVQDPKEAAPFPELKDADVVIHPEMKGIGSLDFAKRNEATFRGKKAVLEKIDEIKHWVGMPQGEP